MLVRVVRVVADEVGERHQVVHVAVAQVAQPVRGVHRAVERGVLRQRPVDPAQCRVEAAVVGQRAGDVRVDGEVVGVERDSAFQCGERLGGPAGAAVRVPEPHLAEFGGLCAYPPGGPGDGEGDLAETPGQRGRRAQQQRMGRMDGDRVAGQREVRRERLAQPARRRVRRRRADLHEDPGGALGVEAFRQLGGGHPGHRGPRRGRRVAGGGGQQVEPFGGAAGGGEQVRAGHHGADERLLAEREEVQVAAAGRVQAGERLVRLGQRGGADQRGGHVVGGVPQVSLAQRQPGQCEFLLRGERGVVLGHVVLSPVGSVSRASLGDLPSISDPLRTPVRCVD